MMMVKFHIPVKTERAVAVGCSAIVRPRIHLENCTQPRSGCINIKIPEEHNNLHALACLNENCGIGIYVGTRKVSNWNGNLPGL
jgi:hypothetical protein